MFKFNELRSVHLEISTRCQASCPMCPRKYHGGVENQNLKIADWTFDEFKTVFTDSLLKQLEIVYFCGNFGDPIMNDDLIFMCQYIKDNAPHIDLRIHTNGGARSPRWWQALRHALPEKHMVFFGIDGLEDTHHIYRIGTKYENVIRNATTFINEGGIAEWVFIKFKHNEHQDVEAERRSKELGFRSFTMKNTTRFVGENRYSVVDSEGNVLYYLEPPSSNEVVFMSKEDIKNYKKLMDEVVIDCYVARTKEVYIDAHKNVFPCCFLSSAPYHYQPTKPPADDFQSHIHGIHNRMLDQYYKLVTSLGGIENLSALTRSVEDIIDDDKWQTVWDEYWTTNKLITCARVCGKTKISKPKDQFVKRVNNV